MVIGMLGLIVIALFANIGYYEYRFPKDIEKDNDVMAGYLELYRRKYGRR